jgi:predicted ATPase
MERQRQLLPGLGRDDQAVKDGRFAGPGFLSAVKRTPDAPWNEGEYPFSLPALKGFERLEFHPAVTFFVGENGSGKSTLLEALAVKLRLNPEGGGRDHGFETRPTHSDLHAALTLERRGRMADAFFVRAESMYNLASALEDSGSLLFRYGGRSLHRQSHGEAFLSVLNHRFEEGGGVFLFDEPEAALSAQRQIGAIALMHGLVRRRSQFVIATHSPILLAYPNARICEFSASGIRTITYDEADCVQSTRDFLGNRDAIVQALLKEETLALENDNRR